MKPRPDDILTTAMLVELKSHFWTGHRRDRDVSATAAGQYRAIPYKSGFFNKRLVPEEALSRLSAIHRNARDQHNLHTLPWNNDGKRVLTRDNHSHYVSTIDPFIEASNTETAVLTRELPHWIDQWRPVLGDMHRDSDYPTPEELQQKFGLSYHISSIPTGHHFLVALNGDRDRIRHQIDEDTKQRLHDGATALYHRINDALAHLADRMGKDANGHYNRFYDTTFEKLADIARVAPRLNIYNDHTLDDICAQIEHRILPVAPETVRPTSPHFDPNLRAQLQRDSAALAEQLAGYFPSPSP